MSPHSCVVNDCLCRRRPLLTRLELLGWPRHAFWHRSTAQTCVAAGVVENVGYVKRVSAVQKHTRCLPTIDDVVSDLDE